MLDRSNSASSSPPQVAALPTPSLHVIHAELIGANTCTALGIVAKANTPVLELCRELIAAGHNPATQLEAYRGDVLCLRVRSIGEAAQLEISGNCGFKRRSAVRTASPIASRGPGRILDRGAKP